MSRSNTYFRPTTAQQRKLLFETWEATKNVTEACRRARVSRTLFYNWKARFLDEGYAGLEQCKSHRRKQVHKKDKAIEERVINLYQAHPDWGKKRIEQELAKENNWVAVVSLNTVKRILEDANLWTSSRKGKKSRGTKRDP